MSDEECVMPIRQSSIDHLCSVYSVMNAAEIVIGKFHYDRKLKHKASKRIILFKKLLGYLTKHDVLEDTLIWGFDDIDAKGGFIDIATKSAQKYQKRKLRKQIAFDTDDVTLDEYWKAHRAPESTGYRCHYQYQRPHSAMRHAFER